MNAQEKITEYAHGKNDTSMTDQEFAGMMIKEGAVINRTPSSKTIARITRQGRQIIITETTVTGTSKAQDGKLVFGETTETVEIARIDL